MNDQAAKAEKLRQLHQGPKILVLPNAWDAASARIFEDAGFPAIATTSAGVAFSQGYPDGQFIPRDEMLAAVKKIANSVKIPVTADLESGYEDVAKTATSAIESGAVGLNLEDFDHADGAKLFPIALQVEKIKTIRRVSDQLGVRLVINARTDQYLAEIGEPAQRFASACERLHAYIAAGADCVFVPGVTDEDTLRRLVAELKFPLNALAQPPSPSISRLQQLGVARVSVGAGITRAVMGLTQRAARELHDSGTYRAMFDGAMPWNEANQLFKK
ncbi:MAG TPA: isocitrate lyase/phosphoenolpyruvate mutase family protein [Candidatus Acidoferrales bacterium]